MRKVLGIDMASALMAAFVLGASLVLAGCGESSDVSYNKGRVDGYAVGFNTACKIRASFIIADWENKHYSRGYADGVVMASPQ